MLATRLEPPAVAPRQVPRRALVDAVCGATHARLVLMRAPAGFGKTTLMLQCREQLHLRGVATAWLAVDRADNDASRFLHGFDAAVQRMDGPQSDDERPAKEPGGIEEFALGVLGRVASLRGPFAIFLDDFESIQEQGVLALLRELVENLPPAGRLIVGSRSLPDLRLGRLRARGQLLEIDVASLRFTLEQTAEFFATRSGSPLAREQVALLHDKTEGWAAALRLASVALERSDSPVEFIRRFSGTERSVSEYLAEDVLGRQSEAARNFLLRTSILRHLEPSLCDALVPGGGSRAMLEELQRADVLLVPLGTDGGTWRYHSLFSDFLQGQLARGAPALRAGLHGAASAWFERQGRPVPAIDHALDGGDIGRAVSLISAYAMELLQQGRMRLLARWFDAIPAEALAGGAHLQLVRIWAVYYTRGAREAMEMLDRSGVADSADPVIRAHVNAQRPSMLALMDRYEEAYEIGFENLKQLPSEVPFADTVLANAMATIMSVMGDPDRARRLVDMARRGRGAADSEFSVMYSETIEGLIDLLQGRQRQACARFRLAVTAMPPTSYRYTGGNAWAAVPHATALYEAGEMDEAAHMLQVYLPLVRDVGLPDHLIMCYTALCRISFWRGDVDQALQLLAECEYAGHKGGLPRVVANAKVERAHLLLLQGNPAAARTEMDRAEDPELWERVERLRFPANDVRTMELSRLRWDLHAADPEVAARRLESALNASVGDPRRRRLLKLRLLHAAAVYRLREAPRALLLLEALLRETCAEGFLRILLDEGDAVRPVIHALDASLAARPGPRSDPVFDDYVKRLATALGPVVPEAVPDARRRDLPLEALTRKELRVVQLLAEGYSNGAIAEKLFISDSTVRTHLRNINSKLDAHSRTEAVALSRRFGLIP